MEGEFHHPGPHGVECRRARGVDLVAEIPRREHRIERRVQGCQRGQDLFRVEAVRIELDRGVLVETDRGVRPDEVDDSPRAVAKIPVVREHVRVVVVDDRIVRCDDVAALGIKRSRKLIEGDLSCPLVLVGPTGHGERSVTTRPDRYSAGGLVPDVAFNVRIDDVLCRDGERPQRCAEVVPIGSSVETDERLNNARVRIQCRPSKCYRVWARRLDTRTRELLQVSVGVRDDRAVSGGFDLDRDRVAACDLDRLLVDLHVDPGTVHLVLIRIGGVDPLDEEVLHIGPEIRESPSDVRVVADHNAWHTGEREACDIEWAGVRHVSAVEAVLIPDRRHLNTEVRIVREDR